MSCYSILLLLQCVTLFRAFTIDRLRPEKRVKNVGKLQKTYPYFLLVASALGCCLSVDNYGMFQEFPWNDVFENLQSGVIISMAAFYAFVSLEIQ